MCGISDTTTCYYMLGTKCVHVAQCRQQEMRLYATGQGLTTITHIIEVEHQQKVYSGYGVTCIIFHHTSMIALKSEQEEMS